MTEESVGGSLSARVLATISAFQIEAVINVPVERVTGATHAISIVPCLYPFPGDAQGSLHADYLLFRRPDNYGSPDSGASSVDVRLYDAHLETRLFVHSPHCRTSGSQHNKKDDLARRFASLCSVGS